MKIGHDNIRTLSSFICWGRRAEWLETSVMLLGRNHITHTCTSTLMSQWCGGAPGARSEHSTHKTHRCSTPGLHTHCLERKRTEWAHVDPYEQRLCWYHTTCKTTLLAQNTTHAGTLPVPALANVGQRHHLNACVCLHAGRADSVVCILFQVCFPPHLWLRIQFSVCHCVWLCVCVCDCVWAMHTSHTHTHTHIYIYIYIYIYTYIHTHTSMCGCRLSLSHCAGSVLANRARQMNEKHICASPSRTPINLPFAPWENTAAIC